MNRNKSRAFLKTRDDILRVLDASNSKEEDDAVMDAEDMSILENIENEEITIEGTTATQKFA